MTHARDQEFKDGFYQYNTQPNFPGGGYWWRFVDGFGETEQQYYIRIEGDSRRFRFTWDKCGAGWVDRLKARLEEK